METIVLCSETQIGILGIWASAWKTQIAVVAVVVVQLLSCVQLFASPWTEAHQASLSFTISWSLLKLMSIESVTPSNHLILCCPLLLPSIFPSIRVFSNESALHIRWPKYGSFSFHISPPKNIQGRFSLGLTGLILQFKELSSVISNNAIRKHQILSLSLLYGPALTSIHEKIHSFDCIRPLLVKRCVCFLTCCLDLS